MDNSSLQFVEESVVSHNANNSVLSELDDILQKCDQSQINSKRKLNKNNNPNNSTTNSRPKSRGADVSLVNSDNEEEKENRADHIPFPSFHHSNNNNNNNTLSDDISPICNERDDVESVHDAQRLNSETMHTNTLPNINENYTNLFNFSDSALETEGLVRSGGSRSPSVHHNTSHNTNTNLANNTSASHAYHQSQYYFDAYKETSAITARNMLFTSVFNRPSRQPMTEGEGEPVEEGEMENNSERGSKPPSRPPPPPPPPLSMEEDEEMNCNNNNNNNRAESVEDDTVSRPRRVLLPPPVDESTALDHSNEHNENGAEEEPVRLTIDKDTILVAYEESATEEEEEGEQDSSAVEEGKTAETTRHSDASPPHDSPLQEVNVDNTTTQNNTIMTSACTASTIEVHHQQDAVEGNENNDNHDDNEFINIQEDENDGEAVNDSAIEEEESFSIHYSSDDAAQEQDEPNDEEEGEHDISRRITYSSREMRRGESEENEGDAKDVNNSDNYKSGDHPDTEDENGTGDSVEDALLHKSDEEEEKESPLLILHVENKSTESKREKDADEYPRKSESAKSAVENHTNNNSNVEECMKRLDSITPTSKPNPSNKNENTNESALVVVSGEIVLTDITKLYNSNKGEPNSEDRPVVMSSQRREESETLLTNNNTNTIRCTLPSSLHAESSPSPLNPEAEEESEEENEQRESWETGNDEEPQLAVNDHISGGNSTTPDTIEGSLHETTEARPSGHSLSSLSPNMERRALPMVRAFKEGSSSSTAYTSTHDGREVLQEELKAVSQQCQEIQDKLDEKEKENETLLLQNKSDQSELLSLRQLLQEEREQHDATCKEKDRKIASLLAQVTALKETCANQQSSLALCQNDTTPSPSYNHRTGETVKSALTEKKTTEQNSFTNNVSQDDVHHNMSSSKTKSKSNFLGKLKNLRGKNNNKELKHNKENNNISM